MYYWLQPRIQACPDYGPKLGIECKNESYVDSLFEKGMTVDIVTLDQLSPESFTWGNIYVTLDKTRWSGYEIFMKPIVHIEEDKNLPSVYYPVSSTFGKLDYWDVRSEPRFDPSDPFLTLYIRMSGLINKNYVKYYSLEDALTKIGSWERILWMIVGTICIYYNLKSVSKEEENLVMSAPFVMDETNADQVMDVEEAHERLSSINPNTHQAKLLRRALSVQSQSRSAERRASIQSNSSMKSSSILQHLRAHVTEAKNHLGHDNLHSHPHQQHVGGMQQQQQLKGMLLNPDLCEAGPDVHVSLANGVSASRLASDASDRQTRNIKPPGSPILKHRKPMVAATSEAGLSKDFLPKHVAYSEAAPSAADGHYHAHPATNGANGISHHSPVPNQGHGLHSANGYSAAAQLLPPPVFGGGDAINGVNGASLYCAPAMDVSRSAPLPNYACAANGSFAAPQGHEGVGPVASEQRELMYRAISPDGAVHVSTAPAAAPHGAGGGGATLMVSPGWQAAAHPRGVDIDGGAAVDERFTEAGGGSHQWA